MYYMDVPELAIKTTQGNQIESLIGALYTPGLHLVYQFIMITIQNKPQKL